MIKLVDKNDNGELPLAKYITRIELIPELVKIVSELLIQLKPHIENKNLIPFYCFKVEAGYKVGLESILNHLMTLNYLSKGCYFYTCDGMKIFEVRGPSGGITTSVCFYLMALGE